MTDNEIAEEAKRRYPYSKELTKSQLNAQEKRRRRFIEGAKWMRDLVVPQGDVIGWHGLFKRI